jgi:putative transposase
MRRELLARALMLQLGRAKSRFWRIAHFSLQATHLHLIVEADSASALGRAMKGLGVRVAKAVNAVLRRTGRVMSGRFFAHPLKTPREVRRALVYVLFNGHKHGVVREGLDPWSSAVWFQGWREPISEAMADRGQRGPPIVAPRTWLLSVGWRRHGLLTLHERPA